MSMQLHFENNSRLSVKDPASADILPDSILPGIFAGSERYSNAIVCNNSVEDLRIFDNIPILQVTEPEKGVSYERRGVHALDRTVPERIFFIGNEVLSHPIEEGNPEETVFPGSKAESLPSPFRVSKIRDEAFRMLTGLLELIKEGAAWPTDTNVGRLAFMSKDNSKLDDALAYRFLSILSVLYRRWATVRLRNLKESIATWAQYGFCCWN